MSYQNQMDSAKASGQMKRLIPQKIVWTDGLMVVGEYVGHTELKGKKRKDKPFNVYQMLTDEGLAEFTLGGPGDRSIGKMFKIGHLYTVQFTGKKDIGKGHMMNTFDCQEFGEEPDAETVNKNELLFDAGDLRDNAD